MSSYGTFFQSVETTIFESKTLRSKEGHGHVTTSTASHGTVTCRQSHGKPASQWVLSRLVSDQMFLHKAQRSIRCNLTYIHDIRILGIYIHLIHICICIYYHITHIMYIYIYKYTHIHQ